MRTGVVQTVGYVVAPAVAFLWRGWLWWLLVLIVVVLLDVLFGMARGVIEARREIRAWRSR